MAFSIDNHTTSEINSSVTSSSIENDIIGDQEM